jgi:hypothetical protein
VPPPQGLSDFETSATGTITARLPDRVVRLRVIAMSVVMPSRKSLASGDRGPVQCRLVSPIDKAAVAPDLWLTSGAIDPAWGVAAEKRCARECSDSVGDRDENAHVAVPYRCTTS